MAEVKTASEKPKKPVPRPAPESVPYWKAAKRHKLAIPHCKSCGHYWFPPSQRCTNCLSADMEWAEVSGRGKVYSFVTFHRVFHPAFEEEVPYVVALVELEEGPRMLTNVIGIPPEEVRCEMKVKVTFDDVTPDATVPKFVPA